MRARVCDNSLFLPCASVRIRRCVRKAAYGPPAGSADPEAGRRRHCAEHRVAGEMCLVRTL